jgi:hypothetical protein
VSGLWVTQSNRMSQFMADEFWVPVVAQRSVYYDHMPCALCGAATSELVAPDLPPYTARVCVWAIGTPISGAAVAVGGLEVLDLDVPIAGVTRQVRHVRTGLGGDARCNSVGHCRGEIVPPVAVRRLGWLRSDTRAGTRDSREGGVVGEIGFSRPGRRNQRQ